MDIIVVGVSYKNTPIDVREKLSFTKKKFDSAYTQLNQILNETVILSTCNRSEIYGASLDGEQAITQIKEFFCRFHGLEKGSLDQYFYMKKNADCVEHLFLVTAGLDSQVLGEDQILGQVKDAHACGLEKRGAGRVLNKLFRDSITYGKKVRQETKISQNPTSISYIAVQYLGKEIKSFSDKNVLLIGAGKMNRLALNYLKDMGFARIMVANRTYQVAESLKEVYPNIEVILFDQIEAFLPVCDVVISSTAAPHLIIKRNEIIEYKNGSIYMDLAVPRDIDPRVSELDGITLIDLDVLEKIQEENQEKRRQAGEKAECLIQKAVEEFLQWLQLVPLFPVIKQIESYHEHVLSKEMPELIDRLKNTEDEAKIAVLLKSFVKKIYSPPLIRLKQFSALENKEDLTEVLEAMYKEESV
ncbi:MAG: glutamyl-tRNA reductase [Dehalobacterium sp.]